MFMHWATTYISSPHISQTLTTFLPYSNSERTRQLIVLSGEEPFKSKCYDGLGLVVHGCQQSAQP